MATAKHKIQRLVFTPAHQKSVDFLDELRKLANDAFRVGAQTVIEQFIDAKKLAHLKKSNIHAHLENETYEQIVSHLEKELELNGLEAPDEKQINTVTKQATKRNPDKPKPTCRHCKKSAQLQNQCRQIKKERDQFETNKTGKNNGCQTNSNSHNNKNTSNGNANNANNQNDVKPGTVYPPCETGVKQTTLQKNAILEPMQQLDGLLETKDRWNKIKINNETHRLLQLKVSKLWPKL